MRYLSITWLMISRRWRWTEDDGYVPSSRFINQAGRVDLEAQLTGLTALFSGDVGRQAKIRV
jgi:hypothetical protein